MVNDYSFSDNFNNTGSLLISLLIKIEIFYYHYVIHRVATLSGWFFLYLWITQTGLVFLIKNPDIFNI